MPAHTKEKDIGRAQLSDGSLLTAADRAGNELADTLAKRGADSHRLPAAVLDAVLSRERLAVWAARELAIRTSIANRCPRLGQQPARDSAGVPQRPRRVGALPAQRPQRPAKLTPATSSGSHAAPAPQPTASCESSSSSTTDAVASCSGDRNLGRARRRRALASARRRAERSQLQGLLVRRHADATRSAGDADARLRAVRLRVLQRQLAAA